MVSSYYKETEKRYMEFQRFVKSIRLALENPKEKPKWNPKFRIKENIGGINIDTEKKIIRLHIEQHKVVKNPHSLEFLPTATQDNKPPKPNKKHLCRFARVWYHNIVNRKQINGKFVIQNLTETRKLLPTNTEKLKFELHGILKYKRTYQWKTVWILRHAHQRTHIPIKYQIEQNPIPNNKLVCTNITVK